MLARAWRFGSYSCEGVSVVELMMSTHRQLHISGGLATALQCRNELPGSITRPVHLHLVVQWVQKGAKPGVR